MSYDTYPVCRAATEPFFDRSFSLPISKQPELVCRADASLSGLEARSSFERQAAFDLYRGQSVFSRFSTEIWKNSPFPSSQGIPDSDNPFNASLSGLAMFTLGGFAGCASVPPKAPEGFLPQGQVLTSGDYRARYDLTGDPQKFGTILFFRQSYGAMPDMDNTLASLDGYEDTIQYQWHIVKSLEGLAPKHVFVEDLPVDFPAGDRAPLMKYVKEGLGDFSKFFNKLDLPSERQPQYFRLLAAYKQAAIIYALKHEDVSLHRTLSPEESGDSYDHLAQLWIKHGSKGAEVRKDPEFQRLMFELPEAYAVREIMKFYQTHPGETIALLFGKMNQFCDNFQAIHYLPQIASFWWTEPTDSLTIPKACE
ncbi:MAG: hypothetical protein K8R69_11290 [Deltaproteobacteria bacterium]|nr:hypothetical protein [Deltaproteobacteria bacterium]